jgi:hypothetical protein
MSDSPEKLSSILRKLFAVLYAEYGIRAKRIDVIDDEHDKPAVTLPFPKSCSHPCRNGKPHDDEELEVNHIVAITSTERRILKAVAGTDVENPTGDEIAHAIRQPYESHLKKTLSAMRTKGWLGGFKGDVGYPITPLGLSLIELEN